MKRLGGFVVVVLLVAVLGLSSASASRLTLASRPVGAGSVAVPGCDADGVTVAYTNAFDPTTADYRTSAVTVSAIDPSCAGMLLVITVRSVDGVSLFEGATTVPAAPATSVTLPIPPVPSSSIAGWAVVVTG